MNILGALLGSLIKAVAAPFIFMFAGARMQRGADAEASLERGREANAREEDVAGLADDELLERLRDSTD